jgi:ASCH domain
VKEMSEKVTPFSFSEFHTLNNKIDKALSIRQPYAWLICRGYKDIENRNWTTGIRGRIYVHAGVSRIYLKDAENNLAKRLSGSQLADYLANKNTLSFGAIIGEVDIIDCITKSESPWFTGTYGFLLANPVLYDRPLPCKGKLNFFKPDV